MNYKRILITFVLTALVSGAVYLFFLQSKPVTNQPASPTPTAVSAQKVTDFAGCIAAGNPVMESYPRQCQADGQTYTEDIGNELEFADKIRSDNPRPNQTITSPLSIEGEARGTWFFEASFSARLEDADGNLIKRVPVLAKGDWMTEDFVRYSGELEFADVNTMEGKLVLEKANPSGLGENAEELVIPVRFSQSDSAD